MVAPIDEQLHCGGLPDAEGPSQGICAADIGSFDFDVLLVVPACHYFVQFGDGDVADEQALVAPGYEDEVGVVGLLREGGGGQLGEGVGEAGSLLSRGWGRRCWFVSGWFGSPVCGGRPRSPTCSCLWRGLHLICLLLDITDNGISVTLIPIHLFELSPLEPHNSRIRSDPILLSKPSVLRHIHRSKHNLRIRPLHPTSSPVQLRFEPLTVPTPLCIKSDECSFTLRQLRREITISQFFDIISEKVIDSAYLVSLHVVYADLLDYVGFLACEEFFAFFAFVEGYLGGVAAYAVFAH